MNIYDVAIGIMGLVSLILGTMTAFEAVYGSVVFQLTLGRILMFPVAFIVAIPAGFGWFLILFGVVSWVEQFAINRGDKSE